MRTNMQRQKYAIRHSASSLIQAFEPKTPAASPATLRSASNASQCSPVRLYVQASSNIPGREALKSNLTPVPLHPSGAPEIDPTSAASGLTLLIAGLIVLRGKQPLIEA
jgi:hypothetical protein